MSVGATAPAIVRADVDASGSTPRTAPTITTPMICEPNSLRRSPGSPGPSSPVPAPRRAARRGRTCAASGPLAPRLTARFGTRRVCAAGLTLVAAGLVIISQLQTNSSDWLMAAGLIVLGVGMGAAMTPATSAITEALPPSQQCVGSALNDLSREVGGAIGIAVIGSILTSTYSSHVNLTGLPDRIAATVKASYAIASHLGAQISGLERVAGDYARGLGKDRTRTATRGAEIPPCERRGRRASPLWLTEARMRAVGDPMIRRRACR